MSSLLDKFFTSTGDASKRATARTLDGWLEETRVPSAPGDVDIKPDIIEAIAGGSRALESFSLSGESVGTSRDLSRILELPRRPRPTDFGPLRAQFEHLKKSGPCECMSRFGRRCPLELNDTQAWGLSEIREVGGLLGPISVGDGKTLLDLLAAMVIPDCKVAVLLIPPQLRAQMRDIDIAFYGQHWHLPNFGHGTWREPNRPTVHIVAYSELSSAKNSDIMERIRPDLVIADEAHLLRNSTTARVKRFRRYFTAHPETRFCCWSGTLTTKSLRDYAHLSNLALKEKSPTPQHWPTVEEWAGAIDPVDLPSGIGSLSALCRPGEHVRDGYRRRLEDSRGVVASSATMSCPASLVFYERRTVAPVTVMAALTELFSTWKRPDGEELITALDVHRCAKEVSAGLYNHWIWPRGETKEIQEHWKGVRREWHKELREKLKLSREFMDSPLLCTKAAIRWYEGYTHIERDPNGKEKRRLKVPPFTKAGPLPSWASSTWPEWLVTRDTARPETEGVWIDDWLARDCAAWLREGVGICWYEHDLFGHRVAEIAQCGYFGPGREASERIILQRGDHSIVASARSHGVGKNLQVFSRNLLGNQFSDAAIGEQLLGRTHRQGQLSDEVEVHVYRHTPVFIEALDRARMLAMYIEQTLGGRQKLLAANYNF